MHGLRTPREKIAFTAQPKIHSHSQIFRYGQSIFCLPHRPNFSNIFNLCLYWVSIVRVSTHFSNHRTDFRNRLMAWFPTVLQKKTGVGNAMAAWLAPLGIGLKRQRKSQGATKNKSFFLSFSAKCTKQYDFFRFMHKNIVTVLCISLTK